jgi:hypothetical protein
LKRYGAKVIGILVILLLSLYCFPVPAYAIGIGVSPPTLMIYDTLRGNEHIRPVTIFSSADEPITVFLSTRGTIADWATFCSITEPDMLITEISVPANGSVKTSVKVNIPEDAANGQYDSFLDIDTAPLDTPDSGMALQLHSEIHLIVSVTGQEILAGEVTRMNAENTEIGLPMIFAIDFKNTGNVVARPEINIAISQDGESVSEFSYSDTEVKVDASEKINVSWDTNGMMSGDYIAKVNVMLGGSSIAENELHFRILPRGGLSSDGQLTSITTEGNRTVGTVTKILVTFENTGVVETVVNGYAEIYQDEALIKVLDSDQIVVNGGEEGTLTFYFTPGNPGSFEIKVHAMMGGKQTNTVQLFLTVGDEQNSVPPVTEETIVQNPPGTETEGNTIVTAGNGLPTVWYIVIGIAGAAVVASAAYLSPIRKKITVPLFIERLYNKKGRKNNGRKNGGKRK